MIGVFAELVLGVKPAHVRKGSAIQGRRKARDGSKPVTFVRPTSRVGIEVVY